MVAAVEFVDVCRSYGGLIALQGVSFRLEPGELAFLVGPSGAGKTTVLKLINRELRPTSGEVWIDGIPAHSLRAGQVARLRRRIGVVFQDYKLLPRLTVVENVAYALQVTDLGVSDEVARERAIDALDAVGLGGRFDAFPHELSGGQQQRVAIARAVVREPALVIADEPTGNLDMGNAWEIIDLLQDVASFGTAVLVTTHNLEIVSRLQRRVITLENGRLATDRPAPILRRAWPA